MKIFDHEYNFTIHFIVSIFLFTIIEIIGNVLMIRKQAASIGFIEGVDSTSAIFSSVTISEYFSFYLTHIILFIVLLFLYRPIKAIFEKYLM
ncbi:MAG: hypothetical protein K0R93_1063 [Anaerosolibacter sp.]|jgi:hypothetical protein|uniref:hypothetical protein n=1 Tax=Anaerosolibacter sp. TaxID=1872527 RepID=UPI0026272710|nr:hypothetical protein [Anaerosolibacter sp.]MDF2546165.1 hypothetical protein [Anaerosolibacter sp.]